MGNVKQIKIKNRTCCFYNDIIDLKSFKPNLLKIGKKNIAKTLQYTLQTSQDTLQLEKTGDCENIHSVNPLYLLVNNASGYIEEKKWK